MDFEDVYKTYFDPVYRYMLRISGSSDIAEEITCETFFKALKSINGFKGESGVFTWLCRIAENCYNTYMKKRGRTVSLEDAESAGMLNDGCRSVESEVIDRDEARRILHALRDLPETYKEVFVRRVFAGMKFEEIGALFGKTTNWACVTYHRAKKLIAERMEGKK